MEGALPESLILPSRVPTAVQAYRQRFISPSTNVSSAGPDDYVNIYPDTSTPGAFIDPKSTYFMMDFEIVNDNFMVDYANWGIEGIGGAITQDLLIHNQGSILEQINEYGTVASAYATLEGDIQQEVTMYFSNKLKNGYTGQAHKNFIKPPMCDGRGNIMFGLNPFGLGFDHSLMGSTTIYTSDSSVMTMNQTLASVTGIVSLMDSIHYPATGSNPCYTSNNVGTPSWSTGGENFVGVATAPGHGPTPCDWPDFYSAAQSEIVKRNYVREYGSVNKPQIMANLTNVKCFPIGMIPGQDCYSSGGTYGATLSTLYSVGLAPAALAQGKPPVRRENKIRICFQPISGIIGKLAPKMLATTLLAPQQMYFSLHLSTAAVALNLSSDPCRRISGTIRDYVRNIGTQNGVIWGTGIYVSPSNLTPYTHTDTSYAIGYNPAHSIPITVGSTYPTQSSLNSIFTSSACQGLVKHGNLISPVNATPQYILTKTPWLYKAVNTATLGNIINYAAENQVFYGTYLTESVPQSKRIFQFSSSLGAEVSAVTDSSGSYANNSSNITYRVSNISFVGDRVILPNEITDMVVRDAAQGNFSVMTNSVRTYQMPILTSNSQSILIPAKISMARQLLLVFQNLEQRSGSLGYYYDSNCGYNPFATISRGVSNTNAKITGYNSESAVSTSVYGVGFKSQLAYKPTTVGPGTKSYQLRIGNEFYPPQPITTLQEMSAELTKTMKGWNDSKYSPDFDAPIVQAFGAGNSYVGDRVMNSDVPVYDCLAGSTFATAFVNAELLDDQTITANTDFVPLYNKNGIVPPVIGLAATHVSNGFNYLCPRGHCVNGLFTVPSGRFIMGTNLARFVDGDTTSGTYLGNNTITAIITGAEAFTIGNWRAIAIIPHEAQMNYMAGGQILWNY